MEIIEVTDLTKKYSTRSNRLAVNHLNISIPEGQFFGLLGPDGAGKTTTLRIIATVLEPSEGNVRVSGKDVIKQAEQVRKQIGYMPQSFSLYPDLTVDENLNFFADIQHLKKEKKKTRIEEMLRFTHLQNFRKARARVLSGGMKKKLALACAMIHDPKILLLDEPSTGVDPISRRELWEILALVVQRGVTVVISTPYMDEAERCHNVGILYEGSLLAYNTPSELVRDFPYQVIEVNGKPRKSMRRIVSETDGIMEWRPVGDRLRLLTSPNHNGKQPILVKLDRQFQKEKMEIRSLHITRPTLEDIFVNLVNQKRREA